MGYVFFRVVHTRWTDFEVLHGYTTVWAAPELSGQRSRKRSGFSMHSLSIKANSSYFFQMFKTWNKGDQRKKGHKFVDRLAEVCHTEAQHQIFSLHV